MFSTQSTLISDDPGSDVKKSTSSGGRKKKMAKQKQSQSKVQAKNRTKANESFQQDSQIGIQFDFGSQPTPPIHSSEVSFGVSISHTHTYTHEESAHHPPHLLKKMVQVLNIVP